MKEEVKEAVVLSKPLMSFVQALTLLLAGKVVCRVNWNGKGMYIFLQKGSISPEVVKNISVEGVLINDNNFELGAENTGTRLPHIAMRTAQGNLVTGWLASQTDMLASDWMEYEGETGDPIN